MDGPIEQKLYESARWCLHQILTLTFFSVKFENVSEMGGQISMEEKEYELIECWTPFMT